MIIAIIIQLAQKQKTGVSKTSLICSSISIITIMCSSETLHIFQQKNIHFPEEHFRLPSSFRLCAALVISLAPPCS